jgi:hypothetical protein
MGRTLNPGTWRLAVVCLAAGLGIGFASGVSAAGSNRDAALERAHAKFVSAHQRHDWKALRGMLETFGTPVPVSQRLLRDYVDQLTMREASGQAMVRQMVERVDYFEDGPRQVAFLRVVTLYTHPMTRVGSPEKGTVYAFSRNGGRSWTFSATDCMSEQTLRRVAPAYAGVPDVQEAPGRAGE